jgi:hypothetical protein
MNCLEVGKIISMRSHKSGTHVGIKFCMYNFSVGNWIKIQRTLNFLVESLIYF